MSAPFTRALVNENVAKVGAFGAGSLWSAIAPTCAHSVMVPGPVSVWANHGESPDLAQDRQWAAPHVVDCTSTNADLGSSYGGGGERSATWPASPCSAWPFWLAPSVA
jgi:hypothetical protein